MSEHSPEPWQIIERDAIEGPAIRGPERLITILHGIVSRERALADADRIVACVNACAGLNPDAVPKLLEALEELRRLGWGNPATNSRRIIGIGGELDQAIAKARAAIAEAEEIQDYPR